MFSDSTSKAAVSGTLARSLAIAAAAVLLAARPGRTGERVRFDPDGVPLLSPLDRDFLLSEVRRVVEGRLMRETGRLRKPPEACASPCDRRVFITLFWEGRRVGEADAVGTSLYEATRMAADSLADQVAALRGGRTAVDKGQVKMDIMGGAEEFDVQRVAKLVENVELGLQGLLVDARGRREYFLPLAILRHSTAPDPLLSLYQEKRSRPPDHLDRARAYTFPTVSFVESGPAGPSFSLYRGNVLLQIPGPKSLIRSYLFAARWFLRVQTKGGGGKFLNWYDPLADHVGPTYNVVRHAEACISLARLYALTDKERVFLDACDRGLGYLRSLLPRKAGPGASVHVQYGSRSDLASSAAFLLALVARAEATGEGKGDRLVGRLADFVLEMQLENGGFYTYVDQKAVKRAPESQDPEGTGLALLALARLNRLSPSEKWAKAAMSAALFRVYAFSVKGGDPDPRVMMAIEALLAGRKDAPEVLGAKCLEMADALCSQQIAPDDTRFRDYAGGFRDADPPTGGAAAMRIRGLAAAYRLAEAAGDAARKEKYARAILEATRFLMQLQYRPDNSYYARELGRVLGAFRSSPTDLSVRLDVAAHAVSALDEGAEIANRWRVEGSGD